MREALGAWLADQRGTDAAVAEVRRITTGHSRANWYVALDDGARFVVRVEQGGVFGTSGAAEFDLMRRIGALGFPVAPVRFSETTGSVIGQPFFVMDFVDSATGDREDRGLSDALAADYVRRLHELHSLDWRAEIDTTLEPADATHAQIDRWAAVYRRVAALPIPLLEEAAAWLHHHAPPLERLSIVHADAGPGNFLHDGERVVAFTDWEFAHLGDPREDWAYLIAMRGARTMAPERWRALFEREVGVVLTDADVRYWGAFNFFKGACANRTCLAAFDGPNPAPNMAMIGTVLQQTFLRQLASLVGGS